MEQVRAAEIQRSFEQLGWRQRPVWKRECVLLSTGSALKLPRHQSDVKSIYAYSACDLVVRQVNGISPQYLLGILILNWFVEILVIGIILDKALLEEQQSKKKCELTQKRRFGVVPTSARSRQVQRLLEDHSLVLDITVTSVPILVAAPTLTDSYRGPDR